MNDTQTPLARMTRVHRNLESLATVATMATALLDVACSRCHPIKKVATTGNTHPRFNISARSYCDIWLSLLPVKNQWQQNCRADNGWRPRIPELLPLLPLLPVFFESQKYWITSNQGEVSI